VSPPLPPPSAWRSHPSKGLSLPLSDLLRHHHRLRAAHITGDSSIRPTMCRARPVYTVKRLTAKDRVERVVLLPAVITRPVRKREQPGDGYLILPNPCPFPLKPNHSFETDRRQVSFVITCVLLRCSLELRTDARVHIQNVRGKGNRDADRDGTETGDQAAVATFARRRNKRIAKRKGDGDGRYCSVVIH